MFRHRITIERVDAQGSAHSVPVAQIDSFAMRNFTNDVIFDDTLPVRDGLIEVGNLVPLELLRERMELWFRRKGYLANGEQLRLTEL